MENFEAQIITYFSEIDLVQLSKGVHLLRKSIKAFDYQLRFKNN